MGYLKGSNRRLVMDRFWGLINRPYRQNTKYFSIPGGFMWIIDLAQFSPSSRLVILKFELKTCSLTVSGGYRDRRTKYSVVLCGFSSTVFNYLALQTACFFALNERRALLPLSQPWVPELVTLQVCTVVQCCALSPPHLLSTARCWPRQCQPPLSPGACAMLTFPPTLFTQQVIIQVVMVVRITVALDVENCLDLLGILL